MSVSFAREEDGLSTGQRFAKEFISNGMKTEVHYDFTITEEFKPADHRPRLMVSRVIQKRKVQGDSCAYWSENRPPKKNDVAQNEMQKWQESRVRFGSDVVKVEKIQGWAQLPEALKDDPVGLADFVDYRLVLRLGTAENEALLIGPQGLLNHPGVTQIDYGNGFVEALLKACDKVEQNGATAHAIIVNSEDYYGSMVGQGSLLQDFNLNGTTILRTRMIDPGCALVGDFAVATRFMHFGKSVIRVAEAPAGMFNNEGIAVCAESSVGLAVNMPTHFYHIKPK